MMESGDLSGMTRFINRGDGKETADQHGLAGVYHNFLPRARGGVILEAILRTTSWKEDLAYDGYASSRSDNLAGVHLS